MTFGVVAWRPSRLDVRVQAIGYARWLQRSKRVAHKHITFHQAVVRGALTDGPGFGRPSYNQSWRCFFQGAGATVADTWHCNRSPVSNPRRVFGQKNARILALRKHGQQFGKV